MTMMKTMRRKITTRAENRNPNLKANPKVNQNRKVNQNQNHVQ